MELDKAGFSEVNLETAWREMTNQEIAAKIVGFIRHIATGDPLAPYEQRVIDLAAQQILTVIQTQDSGLFFFHNSQKYSRLSVLVKPAIRFA
jgi:hypothetical protein